MIITVANQKGGIAKTTTCLNLGAAAALDGKKVCLIDLDPQANLTKTLIPTPGNQPTIYHSLRYSAKLSDAQIETSIPNLYLIPGASDLSKLESASANAGDWRKPYLLLQEILQPFSLGFDLVLIDTPPALGLLTLNALLASKYLVIPIQPSYYPLQGTNDLFQTYQIAKRQLNTHLELLGVLITMYDPRTTLAREALQEIKNFFGDKVLETMIHRNVKVEESPASGQSVITYAPKSQGAAQYQAVYRELMSRV
jgi:chromosome partitioning protein